MVPSQNTGAPFWSTKYLPLGLTLTGKTGSAPPADAAAHTPATSTPAANAIIAFIPPYLPPCMSVGRIQGHTLLNPAALPGCGLPGRDASGS